MQIESISLRRSTGAPPSRPSLSLPLVYRNRAIQLAPNLTFNYAMDLNRFRVPRGRYARITPLLLLNILDRLLIIDYSDIFVAAARTEKFELRGEK